MARERDLLEVVGEEGKFKFLPKNKLGWRERVLAGARSEQEVRRRLVLIAVRCFPRVVQLASHLMKAEWDFVEESRDPARLIESTIGHEIEAHVASAMMALRRDHYWPLAEMEGVPSRTVHMNAAFLVDLGRHNPMYLLIEDLRDFPSKTLDDFTVIDFNDSLHAEGSDAAKITKLGTKRLRAYARSL